MRVSEVMTRDVECTSPNATVQDAASKMKILNVGPLPVKDKNKLVGIVTDRDISIRATAEGKSPTDVHVRDIMTRKVIHCYEDALVEEAARMMQDEQIRRLVVINHNKQLVGIVSLGDLARKTGDEQMAGYTLEIVSDPNRAEQ